jgi:hypothetical protein
MALVREPEGQNRDYEGHPVGPEIANAFELAAYERVFLMSGGRDSLTRYLLPIPNGNTCKYPLFPRSVKLGALQKEFQHEASSKSIPSKSWQRLTENALERCRKTRARLCRR